MSYQQHVIGGYRFRIIELNCAQRDKLNALFGDAGLKSINEFLERYADELVSFAQTTRIAQPFYNLILDFDDTNPLKKWVRIVRMKLQRRTKEDILTYVTLEQEVAVWHDFFTVRLGVLKVWANSVKSMASSFRTVPAAKD